MSKRRQRIPESLQLEIAQYYIDNPDCSLEEAGRMFNASRNQVRYAVTNTSEMNLMKLQEKKELQT